MKGQVANELLLGPNCMADEAISMLNPLDKRASHLAPCLSARSQGKGSKAYFGRERTAQILQSGVTCCIEEIRAHVGGRGATREASSAGKPGRWQQWEGRFERVRVAAVTRNQRLGRSRQFRCSGDSLLTLSVRPWDLCMRSNVLGVGGRGSR